MDRSGENPSPAMHSWMDWDIDRWPHHLVKTSLNILSHFCLFVAEPAIQRIRRGSLMRGEQVLHIEVQEQLLLCLGS